MNRDPAPIVRRLAAELRAKPDLLRLSDTLLVRDLRAKHGHANVSRYYAHEAVRIARGIA